MLNYEWPNLGAEDVGVIGCGQLPMPREVSLAHHGILCSDEWPACTSDVLEILRQSLGDGDGVVTIARILLAVTFPTL
jgi:magnesium chelatase family protein